jgi:hypothetical protein
MDREYHLFECLRDGSVVWRAKAHGLQSTEARIKELVSSTGNNHFAMYLPNLEIVYRLSVSAARLHAAATKRIFQIAYSEKLRNERAELLRHLGYRVISVIGNESAKVLLKSIQLDIALFIVGHAASEKTRNEMANWLKAEYPTVRILALNPPNEWLAGADYNVIQNGPEKWLPLVSLA